MPSDKRHLSVKDMKAVFEAQIEAGSKRRLQFDEYRSKIQDRHVFTPLNIAHWQRLARNTSVPFVPIHPLATMPTATLLDFEDHIEEVDKFLAGIHSKLDQGHPGNFVLRWPQCTGIDVKVQMGNGRPEFDDSFRRTHIADPRVYDTLHAYPQAEATVYARPWIDANVIDGYPEEYRVFVWDNKIIGISNYYPQRPLPNDGNTLKNITVVYAMAATLLATQFRPVNHGPWWPEDAPKTNCWTADFIIPKDGPSAMLLEGGPPFGFDADPCCFAGVPSGVALTDHSGRQRAMREAMAGEEIEAVVDEIFEAGEKDVDRNGQET